jgi:hypothetical protein
MERMIFGREDGRPTDAESYSIISHMLSQDFAREYPTVSYENGSIIISGWRNQPEAGILRSFFIEKGYVQLNGESGI